MRRQYLFQIHKQHIYILIASIAFLLRSYCVENMQICKYATNLTNVRTPSKQNNMASCLTAVCSLQATGLAAGRRHVTRPVIGQAEPLSLFSCTLSKYAAVEQHERPRPSYTLQYHSLSYGRSNQAAGLAVPLYMPTQCSS